MPTLAEQFGQIDIYLFDQLLRGRIVPGMRILDAGCGYGRNLVYFLNEGYEVYGADGDAKAIQNLKSVRRDAFRIEPVESMSFPDSFADVVLSSAVLHFAHSDAHFDAMLRGSWRVLKPRGLFFCRLASSIGIETQVRPTGNGRFLLPDGSERYLVTQESLLRWTGELGGEMLDPLKTTVVQNQRSMTTWVLRKSQPGDH